jgi:hypothetical protein
MVGAAGIEPAAPALSQLRSGYLPESQLQNAVLALYRVTNIGATACSIGGAVGDIVNDGLRRNPRMGIHTAPWSAGSCCHRSRIATCRIQHSCAAGQYAFGSDADGRASWSIQIKFKGEFAYAPLSERQSQISVNFATE